MPLSPFAPWWRRVVLLGPLLLGLSLWGWSAWESSAFVRENRLIGEASEAMCRRDYPGALRALTRMANTAHAGRAALMDETARGALKAALADIQDPADGRVFLNVIAPAAPRPRPSWTEGGVAEAAEAALDRIAEKPGAGKVARDFLRWIGTFSPALAARQPDRAARACAKCDDPLLLAEAAEAHLRAGRPCPPEILSRLRGHLLRARHETWDADALSYLRAAEAADARPVLLARAERSWKGLQPDAGLAAVKTLPEALRTLLALDAEPDIEKRAGGLEKTAEGEGLDEPQKTWHRLGAARRLERAFGLLNERDPIRFPVSKARPWAIRAAELAPEDAEARLAAMRHLLAGGDFARVVSLGSAAPDDPRTATLAGIAQARSGKPEEAVRILRPLVEKDLPAFAAAYAEWEKAAEAKSKAVWSTLQRGTADRSVLARLNALPKDRVSAEAAKWVHEQVERDPRVAELAGKWRPLKDVHPAASELAMVELALGRSMPPGEGRKARLEAAERLFLNLRQILQDDARQELQLGQVYFWLGKDKEGSEIFDRLESSGDAHLLHEMGEVYRELSRMDAARRVLEKAYEKADPSEKPSIASTRAMATFVAEEKLEWLRKGDASSPRTRADIDETQARMAIEKGAYEEAVGPLRRVAAYYAGLPESPMAFNNAALIQQEMARVTGDSKHLLEALRLLRRAHESAPEDGIVLGNYVDALGDVGIAALAGNVLRADLLHEMPGPAWLDYVSPQPSPGEWAERAKAQPELRRAAELGAKSIVLSPGWLVGYRAHSLYFSLTRDGDAFRRFRESVETNPPPRQEAEDKARARARGETTENERKAAERHVARWDALLPAIRKGGHAPTLAYALTQVVSTRLATLHLGLPGPALGAAVRDAEEALAVFDAAPTRRVLAAMRMEQAAVGLSSGDPDFAKWIKENPSVSPIILVPLYARKHPDRASTIRGREDVRRAAEAAAERERLPSRDPWLLGWAWLDLVDHNSKDSVLKVIRSDRTILEANLLDRLLSPGDPEEAAQAWLAATAFGEQELAEKIAAQARPARVFPLFCGE